MPLGWLRHRKNLTQWLIGESQRVSMSSPGAYLIRRKVNIHWCFISCVPAVDTDTQDLWLNPVRPEPELTPLLSQMRFDPGL